MFLIQFYERVQNLLPRASEDLRTEISGEITRWRAALSRDVENFDDGAFRCERFAEQQAELISGLFFLVHQHIHLCEPDAPDFKVLQDLQALCQAALLDINVHGIFLRQFEVRLAAVYQQVILRIKNASGRFEVDEITYSKDSRGASAEEPLRTLIASALPPERQFGELLQRFVDVRQEIEVRLRSKVNDDNDKATAYREWLRLVQLQHAWLNEALGASELVGYHTFTAFFSLELCYGFIQRLKEGINTLRGLRSDNARFYGVLEKVLNQFVITDKPEEGLLILYKALWHFYWSSEGDCDRNKQAIRNRMDLVSSDATQLPILQAGLEAVNGRAEKEQKLAAELIDAIEKIQRPEFKTALASRQALYQLHHWAERIRQTANEQGEPMLLLRNKAEILVKALNKIMNDRRGRDPSKRIKKQASAVEDVLNEMDRLYQQYSSVGMVARHPIHSFAVGNCYEKFMDDIQTQAKHCPPIQQIFYHWQATRQSDQVCCQAETLLRDYANPSFWNTRHCIAEAKEMMGGLGFLRTLDNTRDLPAKSQLKTFAKQVTPLLLKHQHGTAAEVRMELIWHYLFLRYRQVAQDKPDSVKGSFINHLETVMQTHENQMSPLAAADCIRSRLQVAVCQLQQEKLSPEAAGMLPWFNQQVAALDKYLENLGKIYPFPDGRDVPYNGEIALFRLGQHVVNCERQMRLYDAKASEPYLPYFRKAREILKSHLPEPQANYLKQCHLQTRAELNNGIKLNADQIDLNLTESVKIQP